MPRSVRPWLLLAPALSLLVAMSECSPAVVQGYVSIEGVREPHTPGTPGVIPHPKLVDLHGPDVDLNRVHYVRTFMSGIERSVVPTEVVIILIPGFLGGATTFDPVARDLVEAGQGRIEVWAIDRRPNQLEDRLGARHARRGAELGNLDAVVEAAQHYFPETPQNDIDRDGVVDPQLPLPTDAGSRLPIIFSQDDVRSFMAHWGVDLFMRDWRRLVKKARERVGDDGLVILGGHSQGTGWATRFAAYDFSPDGEVEPGYRLIDGLILFEGGGVGPPSATLPTPAEYLARIADLETPDEMDPGEDDVFLQDFSINFGPASITVFTLQELGPIGEVAAVAGFFDPDGPNDGGPAIAQRTTVLSNFPLFILFGTPMTNQMAVAAFVDDDYQPFALFNAHLGFSDDGFNQLVDLGFGEVYVAQPPASGALRRWKDYDDPTLPVCPPRARDENAIQGTGCAIDLVSDATDRETTPVANFARSQFEVNNGFEWYFLAGRLSLDFAFGNDSSSLGDESLLAITQNAHVDVPVLGIGGSQGLTPSPASFAGYFGSIATPAGDKKAFIIPAHGHLDPLLAADNEAVDLILDFVQAIQSGASPIFP